MITTRSEMKKPLCVFSIIIFLVRVPLGAEVNEQPIQDDPLALFAILEGVATIGSGLAAWDPEGFGITGVTMGTGVTIVGISDKRGFSATTTLVGIEVVALSIYNMTGPPKYGNLSEATIFGRNMIGWQIIVGTILAGVYLKKGEKNSASDLELKLTMNEGGPGMAVAWHFQ